MKQLNSTAIYRYMDTF